MTLLARYEARAARAIIVCATLLLPMHDVSAEVRPPVHEIIVTAQKREELLSALPLPGSVLDGREISADGYRGSTDIADAVPGLTFARSFRGPPILTMRGVGFNSPNLSATSPVGVYVDEVAYPFPAMSEGMLFDLERVEVLKGPQGTLFGRSTTGGLINHIAAKPGEETSGHAELFGGSFKSYGAEAALGGGLGGGFSARAAFRLERGDEGWQESVSRDDRLGRVDRAAGRLSLLYAPDSDISMLLTGHWWRDRSDMQAPQAVRLYPQGLVSAGIAPEDWRAFGTAIGLPDAVFDQGFSPRDARQADWTASQLPWAGTTFTPAPLDFRRDNRLAAVTLRTDAALRDDITLTALSSYAHFRRDETSDGAGWAIENAILQGRGSIESIAQEIRLAGEHPRLDWIAGASWSRDRVTDIDRSWVGTTTNLQLIRVAAAQAAAAAGATTEEQIEALFGARAAESRTRQTATGFALFGQGNYALTPQLKLTLGARVEWNRTHFAGCSRDLGDGNLAATLNPFYGSLGIASALGPGDCVTFLGDLTGALLSGGALPIPPQGLVRDRLAETIVAGRAALAWQAAPDTLLYASLSRGAKAGQFPNIEGNVAAQYAPARQEKLIAGEVGLKARPLPTVAVDLAAFYYDYRDKQVFGAVEDILFTALTRIVNIPRSHVYGLDARVDAAVTRRLSLGISAAFLRTRIDDYIGFDDLGVRQDFAGGSFPYSPEVEIVADATQGFVLPGGFEGELKLTFRHAGESHGDLLDQPDFRIRPYAEGDARLTIRTPDGRSEISLLVQNIANGYRWTNALLATDAFTRYAAMPRRWRLSARHRF